MSRHKTNRASSSAELLSDELSGVAGGLRLGGGNRSVGASKTGIVC